MSVAMLIVAVLVANGGPFVTLTQRESGLAIETDKLSVFVNTKGYVSGTAAGKLVDKSTNAVDLGFGLHVMDFLLAPGQRDDGYMNEPSHGRIAKHYVEGPQICTQAKRLIPRITRGKDFVAVEFEFTFTQPGKGYKPGSRWTQTMVFVPGKRYFYSAETITSANAVDNLFYRIDMPGHIKHKSGDTFERIWLSYLDRGAEPGIIPASEFNADFPPDARHLYVRDDAGIPERMIRAYQVKPIARQALEPSSQGNSQRPVGAGPWLAGMTLDPAAVSEAWCHQRGYVCFIQELHGRAVKAGDTFGTAYIVGWFDSIDEMKTTYDKHKGKTRLKVTESGYTLE